MFAAGTPKLVALVEKATQHPLYEMAIFSPCPIGLSPLPCLPSLVLLTIMGVLIVYRIQKYPENC